MRSTNDNGTETRREKHLRRELDRRALNRVGIVASHKDGNRLGMRRRYELAEEAGVIATIIRTDGSAKYYDAFGRECGGEAAITA